MKIVSQKQAAYLGAVASGRSAGKGPTPAKARKMLSENRGIKMRSLPVRAPARVASKSGARRVRRVSTRGRR